MKKALVTGGAGFIGSHMVDLLIKKKFQVVVLDNFVAGNRKNLLQHKHNKNLKIINKDIKSIKKNDRNFKNTKYIFHFAGLGDIVPSIEKPKEYIMNNAIGTLNILEAVVALVNNLFIEAITSCAVPVFIVNTRIALLFKLILNLLLELGLIAFTLSQFKTKSFPCPNPFG